MKYCLKANNCQHDGDMKLKLLWSFQSLLLFQLNAHNMLTLLAQELYAIWNERQIGRKQNMYLVGGSEQKLH
jgi:hypothetical protein